MGGNNACGSHRSQPAKVLPGGVLFRGLNPAETELYTAGKLAFQPPRPMKAPFNLYDHHEHVLEEFLRTPADPSGRPNAFVSLSHELQIAVYYATHGRGGVRKEGLLALVRLPDDLTRNDHSVPIWHSANANAAFIEPCRVRGHMQGGIAHRVGVHQWYEVQARAIVDQELLLVNGEIKPFEVRQVTPDQWNGTTKPWVEWDSAEWKSGMDGYPYK